MKRKNIKKNQLAKTTFSFAWLEKCSLAAICKSLGVFFIFSLAGWVYLSLADAEQFPVNHVRVLGNYPHVDNLTIKKAVMPLVSQGFFQIELQDIKSEVKQIPWVADVAVSRHWPDQITITVQEQMALCHWNDNALFSTRHELFYPPRKTMPAGLPKLKGPEGLHAKVLEGFFTMKQIIAPLGLSIDEVELDKRHSWELRLSNGMKLIVGKHNYQERMEQFVSIYRKVFESKENTVHYVDLRYRHGMAVRWKTEL